MLSAVHPIKSTEDPAALESARADLKAAFEGIDRLASDKRELKSQLASRFVEIAALTRIIQRAEDERDKAVAAQQVALELAESTKLELTAATAAHADEVVRLQEAHGGELAALSAARENERDTAVAAQQVALELAESMKLELKAAIAAHTDDAARLRTEIDEVRQLAGRRSQSALMAIAQGAPWRWFPRRLRAVALSPLVRRTGLFDEEWYLSRYQDVSAQRKDPARHFIAHGLMEGRFPNRDAAFANGDGGERTPTRR